MNIQGGCLSTRVLPDRGRQLEQRRQCRAVERQLQQRGVELEHEHRCAPGERQRPEARRLRAAGQCLSFGASVLTYPVKDQQTAAASSRARKWLLVIIQMPITHSDLFARIIDFDNLWSAYLAARKGKRYRREVAEFSVNLEENLINIHNHLVWGSWEPGRPRSFTVFEPKRRDIQAPPFADRIVHHALVRVVEPLFERRFIYHSYACRTGKGAQRAVWALQRMLRTAHRNWQTPYVVKADIKSYFASIRHDVLFTAIERVVSCKDTLDLWKRITTEYGHDGVGLPVGALTSQLAANVMLDQLDHAMTDGAGIGRYVRYMDDFIIVAPDKTAAWRALNAAADTVAGLGLALNPKTKIIPAKCGVDFCGYRTWATHILPRKRNMRKARRMFRRMVRQYAAGQIPLQYVQQRVASFLAYTKHCSADRSVRSILGDAVFIKGEWRC